MKEFNNWGPTADGLTQSLLTTWRRCPTKARQVMKGYYKPGDSKAIIFGSVFHEALDIAMTRYQKGATLEELTSAETSTVIKGLLESVFKSEYDQASFDAKKAYRESYSLVTMMLPLYLKAWQGDLYGENKKDFIEIENVFRVDSGIDRGDSLILTGKRDAIFKYPGGDKWLMEHKTKSVIPEDAISMTISRDLQVLMYATSYYLEHGEYLKGVLYNIIRKPGLRIKAGEDWSQYLNRVKEDIQVRPNFYFVRYEVALTEKDINTFFAILRQELVQFLDWYYTPEILDRQHTHECNGVYGKCPFIEYCDSGKTDDALLSIRPKHNPELQ